MLVEAIALAAEAQPVNPVDKIRANADKAKKKADDYRARYEAAIAREVMLIQRLYELKNK